MPVVALNYKKDLSSPGLSKLSLFHLHVHVHCWTPHTSAPLFHIRMQTQLLGTCVTRLVCGSLAAATQAVSISSVRLRNFLDSQWAQNGSERQECICMESKFLCTSPQNRMTKKQHLWHPSQSVSVVIGQFAVKDVKTVQGTIPNVRQHMILEIASELCILIR